MTGVSVHLFIQMTALSVGYIQTYRDSVDSLGESVDMSIKVTRCAHRPVLSVKMLDRANSGKCRQAVNIKIKFREHEL